MKPSTNRHPAEVNRRFANYIAMAVRNAMEGFHVRHLTDAQMKDLNPTIRNAVYTALHAFDNYENSATAKQYVDFTWRMIPDYWEEPQLLDSFLEAESHAADPAQPVWASDTSAPPSNHPS